MLPFKQPEKEKGDYEKRVGILQKEGILTIPIGAQRRPLQITNRAVFDELSFAFFAAWVFNGILNRDAAKVRINFVPLNDESAQTLLVISQIATPYAVPGRDLVESVDENFLYCPLDRAQGQGTTKEEQVLCPVLNKLRYNLGQRSDVKSFQIPQKSQSCCESRKQSLWQYLGKTVVTDPHVYGWLFGGVVVPLQLSPKLVRLYLTGFGENNADWGFLFDEILLLDAMAYSGAMIGIPHAATKTPFNSNEIDFLLYDSKGKKKTPDHSLDACKAIVADQGICIFETTVGHRKESDEGRAIGSDHPKNKIINFLALKSLGFQTLHYHYLSVLGLAESDSLAEATRQALEGTAGFEYWSLSHEVPKLQSLVLGALETPIPVADLRAWHKHLMQHVHRVARDFGQLRQLL